MWWPSLSNPLSSLGKSEMSRVPGHGWREGLGQQGTVLSLWEEIGKGAPTGPLADTAVCLAAKREIFVPPSPTIFPLYCPAPVPVTFGCLNVSMRMSLPTQKTSCCPGTQL